MLRQRLIACLDVAGRQVVKGTSFEALTTWGDPATLAARYEAQGADEIVLLDITASLEGRGPDAPTVGRVAHALRIPLTVGGGLATVVQVADVLAAGADKVSLNTPAVTTPDLISEAARRFGSQAVVVAVDVRREGGDWRVYIRGGRQATAWTLVPWLREVEARGAGEILLTSIDRDGTGLGYDLEALKTAAEAVSLPIIASGGARDAAQVTLALRVPGVTGALMAGILHREETTVAALKAYVASQGVPVRAVH
jgi:cyclase